MTFGHRLGMVVGSLAAPGFAQAVNRRWRAALVWVALAVIPALCGTLSVWLAVFAMLVRFAAAISGYVESLRMDKPPSSWWTKLSIAALALGLAAFGFLKATVQGFKIPSSSMYPTLVIGDHIFVDKLSLMWRAPERGEVIVFQFPCQPDRDYVKRVIGVGGDTVEVRCNVVYVNGAPIKNELADATFSYRDRDDSTGEWFPRECSRYRETHGGHAYSVFHDRERPTRDKQQGAGTAEDVRDFPHRDRMFAPSCQQGDFYERKTFDAQPRGSLVLTKPDAKPCEQQLHFVVPPGSLFMMGDNRNNANDSRYWGVVSTDAVVGRAMGIWLNDPPKGAERDWGRLGGIE